MYTTKPRCHIDDEADLQEFSWLECEPSKSYPALCPTMFHTQPWNEYTKGEDDCDHKDIESVFSPIPVEDLTC